MNTYFLYVVYDRVAGTYGEPWCALKDDIAVRKFNYIMSNSPMVASDCELYCVGTYDVESGVITALKQKQFVVKYEVTNG